MTFVSFFVVQIVGKEQRTTVLDINRLEIPRFAGHYRFVVFHSETCLHVLAEVVSIVGNFIAPAIGKFPCAERMLEEIHFPEELIMNRAGIDVAYRNAVVRAREEASKTDRPVVAAELPDGRMVVGKASPLLTASSAMILNALKIAAGIDDSVLLISPEVIHSMQRLKVDYLGNRNPRLHIDEMLVALSIAANSDPYAERAFAALPSLRGSDVHSSVIISQVDDGLYKKLGMYASSEPEYQTKCLFHGN